MEWPQRATNAAQAKMGTLPLAVLLDKPLVPIQSTGDADVPAPQLQHLLIPLVLAGILLLSLLLRLNCLDCRGYWGDEINSLDGASLGLPGIFTGRFGWISNQTPLHYLILWLTMLPVDPTSTGFLVRLPSALVGALTPLVVYGVGREMFGKAQGVLAALMVALSAVHLNHSQELRLYAMMVFLSSLAVYSLLMARRTGSVGWWAAFVVVAIANMENAYVVDTLFMPAFGLYLAWVLWHAWSRRSEQPVRFRRTAVSLVLVSAGYGAVLLDMLNATRTSPNLAGFSANGAVAAVMALLTWFTRFGLDPSAERFIQTAFLLLAALGLYFALRGPKRNYDASFLSILFLVIPAILLALFSTTSVVFQRYALFSMPFYFLLVASGVIAPLGYVASRSARLPRYALVGGFSSLIVLVFCVGAFNYFGPNHLALTYRPDFRGAARYLQDKVGRDDMIVFVDDPGLGYTISNYYWKSNPPAPAFDARDPRLFAQDVKGSIYWVVSAEDLDMLARIADRAQGWSDVREFERVAVLQEAHPPGGMTGGMDRMVSKLEAIKPDFQPVVTLRGCVYEALGQIDKAVDAYKRAGTYFPVGDDYLRTANGFDALGDEVKAWREADISKFWQPGRAQVHEWYAQKLRDAGFTSQSQAESKIAQALH